jgi:hypothetical protein
MVVFLYPRSSRTAASGVEIMNSKWTDLAFKILSALVIPLLLWGVRLEVSKAVTNEKVTALEQKVRAAEAIKDGVTANTNTLGRVEEKLDATNKRLDDIRADLHRSLPPG